VSLFLTAYRSLADPVSERQRRLLATPVRFLAGLAELGSFRGVDAEQTDPLTADLDGVAIDDRGPASDFRRRSMGIDDKRHGEEEYQAAHRQRFDRFAEW
jgi:hypothetical protein